MYTHGHYSITENNIPSIYVQINGIGRSYIKQNKPNLEERPILHAFSQPRNIKSFTMAGEHGKGCSSHGEGR